MQNWVKLRQACSPLEMFIKLREGAEEDAAARNELRKPGDLVGFKVIPYNGRAFSVVREGSVLYTAVVFSWDQSGITVQDRDDKIIGKATLTLTNEGDCKLKLQDGNELTDWQFRKRFLEDLFFNF